MKIYCFSGLGADERVFQILEIDSPFKLVPVLWIQPLENESVESYADRIAYEIDDPKPFGIIGVSFGGVVAQEVAKQVNPVFTIVISSIKEKTQLPLILKLTPNWLLNLIPESLFNLPLFIASYFFSAENKVLLKQILDDTSPKFAKWAIKALKNWTSFKLLNSTQYISGEKDRLLKPFSEASIVKGGGHFMIVDKSQEVSEEINQVLSRYSF